MHVVAWGTLLLAVVPQHLALGTQVFGVGLGVTAYTLGMRHAFDADHIAAIDGTTRKLMAEGRRPVSVGFWFSLGHSSIVLALRLALAAGVRALVGQVEDGSSELQQVTGLIGTSVSGVFLYVIGILNLVVLVRLVRMLRTMRRGGLDEQELERHLAKRGVVARLLARSTRTVRSPWQMYLVGLLFGLGFDTATEVSLLVLAGGAAAVSLPWYALLTLPVLFAAGMSALDSIDGCFMNLAYGWAMSQPSRKVFYNLVTTALSVVVALVIGTVELVSILTGALHITHGPLAAVGNLDLGLVGYALVAVFVLVWAGALALWRLGRVEQRWAPVGEG
jgi:nickel/cobalt transporter (NiCoT) family protein